MFLCRYVPKAIEKSDNLPGQDCPFSPNLFIHLFVCNEKNSFHQMNFHEISYLGLLQVVGIIWPWLTEDKYEMHYNKVCVHHSDTSL